MRMPFSAFFTIFWHFGDQTTYLYVSIIGQQFAYFAHICRIISQKIADAGWQGPLESMKIKITKHVRLQINGCHIDSENLVSTLLTNVYWQHLKHFHPDIYWIVGSCFALHKHFKFNGWLTDVPSIDYSGDYCTSGPLQTSFPAPSHSCSAHPLLIE